MEVFTTRPESNSSLEQSLTISLNFTSKVDSDLLMCSWLQYQQEGGRNNGNSIIATDSVGKDEYHPSLFILLTARVSHLLSTASSLWKGMSGGRGYGCVVKRFKFNADKVHPCSTIIFSFSTMHYYVQYMSTYVQVRMWSNLQGLTYRVHLSIMTYKTTWEVVLTDNDILPKKMYHCAVVSMGVDAKGRPTYVSMTDWRFFLYCYCLTVVFVSSCYFYGICLRAVVMNTYLYSDCLLLLNICHFFF